jgi:membrane protease YdiL (CAAX protease family)
MRDGTTGVVDVNPVRRLLVLEAALAVVVLTALTAVRTIARTAFIDEILAGLWGLAIVVLVLYRWKHPVRLSAPLGHLVIVTAVLLVLLWTALHMAPMSGPTVNIGAIPGPIIVATVLLLLPAIVGDEIFFRGVIFDLVEERRGTVSAVVAAGLLPAAVGLPFTTSLLMVAWTAVTGLTLALSRALTGSLAPALIARTVLGLLSAATIVIFSRQ